MTARTELHLQMERITQTPSPLKGDSLSTCAKCKMLIFIEKDCKKKSIKLNENILRTKWNKTLEWKLYLHTLAHHLLASQGVLAHLTFPSDHPLRRTLVLSCCCSSRISGICACPSCCDPAQRTSSHWRNYMVDLTKSAYSLLDESIMASYNICLKYSIKSWKNFQSTAVIMEDGKEKAISGENMR